MEYLKPQPFGLTNWRALNRESEHGISYKKR